MPKGTETVHGWNHGKHIIVSSSTWYNEISIPLTICKRNKYTTCYFFNISLKEGIVPADWKEANITPLGIEEAANMGNTILGTSVKEKGLTGVPVSADMTVSEQCGLAAAKGNQILGLFRRNITYMDIRL